MSLIWRFYCILKDFPWGTQEHCLAFLSAHVFSVIHSITVIDSLSDWYKASALLECSFSRLPCNRVGKHLCFKNEMKTCKVSNKECQDILKTTNWLEYLFYVGKLENRLLFWTWHKLDELMVGWELIRIGLHLHFLRIKVFFLMALLLYVKHTSSFVKVLLIYIPYAWIYTCYNGNIFEYLNVFNFIYTCCVLVYSQIYNFLLFCFHLLFPSPSVVVYAMLL